METPNEHNKPSLIDRYSVMIKLVIIGILALMLLIPTGMIQFIIHERESLKEGAIEEIHSKWAGDQQLTGPILTIPLLYEIENRDEKITVTRHLHILPKSLIIKGDVFPETLKRGIYDAVVYRSDMVLSGEVPLSGDYDKENFIGIKDGGAFLTFGLSDLRGIEDEIRVKWGDSFYEVQPGSSVPQLVPKGFHVPLEGFSFDQDNTLPFSIQLKTRGSKRLSFLPLGQVTSVDIQSPWNSPKFDGNFLPSSREVNDQGFSATWKVLELNRSFPQSWLHDHRIPHLDESAFGVEFLSPVDDYTKSIRSAKYAIMTIGLTFMVLFLVEVLGKKMIHPLQYLMVGMALCLFYVLLISISEHTNFNLSYFLSSAVVISAICLYSISLFKNGKFVIILGLVLSASFGFIFFTLKSEDYALLMGSIGLFAILATVMYITRNINWYNLTVSGTVEAPH